MTSILKNVCIDKLADIVNKYNNKYHGTINMKLADPKSSTCIDFDKNNNKQDPIFRVGNHARIMTYKKIFYEKATFQIGLKMFFWLKKIKILGHGNFL